MFDNKKVRRFIGVVLLIAFIIGLILMLKNILARYTSAGVSDTDVKIAFYTFKDTYQEGNIFLDNLYPTPDEAPFEYIFTVSNSDGTNVAETSMEYEIQLETTTNLPLDFEIEKKTGNGDFNKLVEGTDINSKLTLDSTGVNYIKRINILNGNFNYNEEEIDTYKINVRFPLKYVDQPEFEDLIENIKVIVDAHQKI